MSEHEGMEWGSLVTKTPICLADAGGLVNVPTIGDFVSITFKYRLEIVSNWMIKVTIQIVAFTNPCDIKYL